MNLTNHIKTRNLCANLYWSRFHPLSIGYAQTAYMAFES